MTSISSGTEESVFQVCGKIDSLNVAKVSVIKAAYTFSILAPDKGRVVTGVNRMKYTEEIFYNHYIENLMNSMR